MFRKSILAPLLCMLLAGACAIQAGEGAPALEDGEKLLDEAAATAVLDGLKASFAKQAAVRANFSAESDDDLMGKRIEKGKLLIKRPDMVLQAFEKNGQTTKAMALIDTKSKTFNPAHNKTVEKDFSKAPKLLALMRAGLVGDFQTLQKYCDVYVFEKAGAGKRHWRVVLVKQRGPLPYARIIARVDEGAAYFSQVKYEYKKGKGNDKTESYTDITAVPDAEITAKDFDIPLFAKGEQQEPESVEDIKDE